MTYPSAYKSPKGEAAYMAVYEAAMNLWPVPYEETVIDNRFGSTQVVVCGPPEAPPLVLLHGYLATSTMWSPNIADFSKEYRVYAIDVMGQPGKSVPNPAEPIRDTAEMVAWLSATLDELNLERVYMAGMSFGGWLGLAFAISAPERIQKLVLLSPGASFLPIVRQFFLRGILPFSFPNRLAVDWYMGWMGFKDNSGDPLERYILDLFYLGAKHYRLHPETARVSWALP